MKTNSTILSKNNFQLSAKVQIHKKKKKIQLKEEAKWGYKFAIIRKGGKWVTSITINEKSVRRRRRRPPFRLRLGPTFHGGFLKFLLSITYLQFSPKQSSLVYYSLPKILLSPLLHI